MLKENICSYFLYKGSLYIMQHLLDEMLLKYL